jgi:CRP/FNR family transcriptional regulator
VPLFATLDDRALAELAGIGRVLRLERKDLVYAEGERYRGPFVVLSGLVVVFKLSEDGRMLVLHVCRPGALLAEGPMFDGEEARYTAHARATRSSELFFLPRERFEPFVRRHPQVTWELSRALATRTEELSQQLANVTMREVTARLARYLLRELEAARLDDEPQPSLELPIAKSSLASYLGTVHETLSRTFARLIAQGIVRVDGPRVTILDRRRLKRLV